MSRFKVACKSYENLADGRLLLGTVRLTEEDEAGYLPEALPVPDVNTLREPTPAELKSLVTSPNDPEGIRIFHPPASLGQEILALYQRSPDEPVTLTLAHNILARISILHAAPNEVSTTISKRHVGLKPGLHQDMYSTPTFGSGLCLEGTRYLAVADLTVDDIDPVLLEANDSAARDRRRAAFSEVVQASIGEGQPRGCMLLRLDEGEMYSGVPINRQAHDGSSWGQDASRLALILTEQPLPPDSYDQYV